MKKKWKKRWIKALESDKYNQAQEALKIVDKNGKTSYCCLGVLCEVAEFKSNKTYSSNDPSGSYTFSIKDKEAAGFLSKKMLKKFEMTDEEQKVLANLNDSEGYTFKKIAKYIQENM